MPIVPGVAYGRMIHRHHFHLLAITQKISTRSNRIIIHYDVVAILPAYIRKIVPKSLAPYADILQLILFDDLKEYLASLTILLPSACLARSTHRHLQIVEEAAKLIQGGGGGQPHYAQAGGKNKDGLSAAVDKVVSTTICLSSI